MGHLHFLFGQVTSIGFIVARSELAVMPTFFGTGNEESARIVSIDRFKILIGFWRSYFKGWYWMGDVHVTGWRHCCLVILLPPSCLVAM